MSSIKFPYTKSQLYETAQLLLDDGNYYAAVALLRRVGTPNARLLLASALAEMGMLLHACDELYALIAEGKCVARCQELLKENFGIEGGIERIWPPDDSDDESIDEQEEIPQTTAKDAEEAEQYFSTVATIVDLLNKEQYAECQEVVRRAVFRYRSNLEILLLALRTYHHNGNKRDFEALLNYLDSHIDKSNDLRAVFETGIELGNLGFYQHAYDWLSYVEELPDYVKYYQLCIPYAIACYNVGKYDYAALLLRDCFNFTQDPVAEYYLNNYDFVNGGPPIAEYTTDVPQSARKKFIAVITSQPDTFGLLRDAAYMQAVSWALYSVAVTVKAKLALVDSIAVGEDKEVTAFLRRLVLCRSLVGFREYAAAVQKRAAYWLLLKGEYKFGVVSAKGYYTFNLHRPLPLVKSEAIALALATLCVAFPLSAQQAENILCEAESIAPILTQRGIDVSDDILACYLARVAYDDAKVYALFGVYYDEVSRFSQLLL